MLTVSIVTYKTPLSELRSCIDSLRPAGVARIYVVDNSQSDDIRDFCMAEGVEYIPNDNTGFGAAHNIAIRQAIAAGATSHLVINTDIEFSPDTIGRLCNILESDPSIGLVQPEIFYADGRMQYACRLLPTPANLICRRFFPLLARKLDRRFLLKEIDRSKPFNVPYLQGSFMLFSTKALDECGLFDERFFMYPEDLDITRRIHKRYKTLCIPTERIIHAHRRESYRNGRMLRIHVVNMIRYFNKWGWLFDAERRKINKRCLLELVP